MSLTMTLNDLEAMIKFGMLAFVGVGDGAPVLLILGAPFDSERPNLAQLITYRKVWFNG